MTELLYAFDITIFQLNLCETVLLSVFVCLLHIYSLFNWSMVAQFGIDCIQQQLQQRFLQSNYCMYICYSCEWLDCIHGTILTYQLPQNKRWCVALCVLCHQKYSMYRSSPIKQTQIGFMWLQSHPLLDAHMGTSAFTLNPYLCFDVPRQLSLRTLCSRSGVDWHYWHYYTQNS